MVLGWFWDGFEAKLDREAGLALTGRMVRFMGCITTHLSYHEPMTHDYQFTTDTDATGTALQHTWAIDAGTTLIIERHCITLLIYPFGLPDPIKLKLADVDHPATLEYAIEGDFVKFNLVSTLRDGRSDVFVGTPLLTGKRLVQEINKHGLLKTVRLGSMPHYLSLNDMDGE